MQDAGRAEKLRAFIISVFTDKTIFKISKTLETRKSLEQGRHPWRKRIKLGYIYTNWIHISA